MKKTAFVTGGSRGIGLGIAEQLAQKGFDLAINGVRDEAAVSDVLEHLRTLGAEVIYCQGDIASAEARASMSVSYTHLDVYKRQIGIRVRRIYTN